MNLKQILFPAIILFGLFFFFNCSKQVVKEPLLRQSMESAPAQIIPNEPAEPKDELFQKDPHKKGLSNRYLVKKGLSNRYLVIGKAMKSTNWETETKEIFQEIFKSEINFLIYPANLFGREIGKDEQIPSHIYLYIVEKKTDSTVWILLYNIQKNRLLFVPPDHEMCPLSRHEVNKFFSFKSLTKNLLTGIINAIDLDKSIDFAEESAEEIEEPREVENNPLGL